MISVPTRRLVPALAVLLLAACGGSGSTAGSGNTPAASPTPSKSANYVVTDACALVTASDASTAIGATVSNQAAGAVAVPGACFYSSSDGTDTVLIFAQAYPDASTAQAVQPDQLTAAFASIYGINNAKSVTGIGDKAVEYTATSKVSGSSGVGIFVFKANVLIFIIMTPSTDATKIEALARTAVGNLKTS